MARSGLRATRPPPMDMGSGALAKSCSAYEVELSWTRDVLCEGDPVHRVGKGDDQPARDDDPRHVAIPVEERGGVLVLDGKGHVDFEPAARVDERRADQGLAI